MDDTITAEALAARERQSHVRHELRAPLAVIYPLLSLLRDGPASASPAEVQDYLDVLDRSVGRMEALITSLTESGWADCSQAPRAPQEVVLGDVLEEVAATRRAARDDGPEVRVSAGAPPTPRAWADLDDVRQIAAALLRNAAAYAPDCGVDVRVAQGDAPGTVVVEVTDAGPGVPPEELHRVFEFGFRGELARERKVPGLGAGLWVCRELAARNGGTVTLESPPGAGVTARLTLPAARGAGG